MKKAHVIHYMNIGLVLRFLAIYLTQFYARIEKARTDLFFPPFDPLALDSHNLPSAAEGD